MWLLRSTHKHISQDTLSEYLDGRLQGRPLERVEQQLEQCDACRQDLTDLQSVVTMMQQLPMEAPRRSFVMSAPPLDLPKTTRSLSNPFLRVPNWVYAGAASFAALALVVTISLDASGGLDSDSFNGDAMATALAPEAAPEQFSVASSAPTGTGGGLEMESAVRSADADAVTNESSSDAGDQAPQAAMAAAAPVAPLSAPMAAGEPSVTGESAAAGEPSGGITFAFGADAEVTALPTSAPNVEPAPQDGEVSIAKAEATGTDGDTESAAGGIADGESVKGPRSGPGSAGLILEELEANEIANKALSDGAEAGISAWWRVLEVVAGILAVLFFSGLILRWRAGRRNSA